MRLGRVLTVYFCKNYSIYHQPPRKTLGSILNMDYLQLLYARIMGLETQNYCTTGKLTEPGPRKVVAFGNVLLDMPVQLTDTKLLERFSLSLNSKGELDVETLSKVTDEAIVENEQHMPHLGGSALNTVRILKRLGTEPLFFGAVGNDKYGDVVEDLLKREGMETYNYRLQKVSDTPTGRCICLIHKDSDACYANIGASAKFTETFLNENEKAGGKQSFLRSTGNKQIFYIEGFFVPEREEVITYIVRNYIQGRRRLAVYLSADYIVKTNYTYMVYLINHAYFVFGNKNEFETLRELWGAKSIDDLAQEILDKSQTVKIIVITRGPDAVTLITNYQDELEPKGEVKFETFNVPRVHDLVDSVGCGDAFAAAFLHAWLEKRSLSECVRIASEVGSKVSTQIGCHLP